MPRRSKPEPLPLSVFRTQPGEYVRAVTREGKRYLLTKSGKPAALLVPVDQAKEEE
ncbi:MAG TPA: type II toxin-antitoxin system prevent-host-death family antitoxin [Myxococcota bacterium]|jgi:prevent-host-death family protein|nr:type II toxin-antitoxin system prevent-host-death family antitoxin [Myxococcota bacterium]